MDKKIKLIAIILGALCLAALFTAFSYVNKYKAIAGDNQQLEKDKQDLRQENNSLAQKAASSQQEASRLKERYDGLKSENEHLTSERDDLQKRYDNLSEEKDKLIDKIQNALTKNAAVEEAGAKVSLEKKLKEAEDKRQELYNRLNQTDQLMQEKLSEVMDVKQDLKDIRRGSVPISGSAVELSPIVVQGSQEKIPSPISSQEITADARLTAGDSPRIVTAKIRSVDSENNFVIFDAGSNQGIREGQILNVFRDSQRIAAL